MKAILYNQTRGLDAKFKNLKMDAKHKLFRDYAKSFPQTWCEKFDQPMFAKYILESTEKPEAGEEDSEKALEQEYYWYHTAMKIVTDGPAFEESEELQVLVGSLDDETEIFKQPAEEYFLKQLLAQGIQNIMGGDKQKKNKNKNKKKRK